MSARFVRDVIGMPDSWPNFLQQEWRKSQDMRGARITEVFASGDEFAIQTKGAICGETFATFVVKDRALRERVMQIMTPDLSVYEAVATAI
jgi:hypothetical protein